VHDFEPSVAQLVLYYDPTILTDPDVTVTTIDIGGDITYQIGLDGDVLMLIQMGTSGGAIVPTDIDLRTPSIAPTI
ncbi:MAG: hypothetical protein KJN60_01225, partial [Boseongicola sp.]|nr:hypothetical protein [Boseongicola sp.]